MAISVIAGADYLEGPIKKTGHTVFALELHDNKKKNALKDADRGHEVVTNSSRSSKRFKMVHFLLQCPVRNEDLSKLQRVLTGSPPPSWPIKVSPRRPLFGDMHKTTKYARRKPSRPRA